MPVRSEQPSAIFFEQSAPGTPNGTVNSPCPSTKTLTKCAAVAQAIARKLSKRVRYGTKQAPSCGTGVTAGAERGGKNVALNYCPDCYAGRNITNRWTRAAGA